MTIRDGYVKALEHEVEMARRWLADQKTHEGAAFDTYGEYSPEYQEARAATDAARKRQGGCFTGGDADGGFGEIRHTMKCDRLKGGDCNCQEAALRDARGVGG